MTTIDITDLDPVDVSSVSGSSLGDGTLFGRRAGRHAAGRR